MGVLYNISHFCRRHETVDVGRWIAEGYRWKSEVPQCNNDAGVPVRPTIAHPSPADSDFESFFPSSRSRDLFASSS